MAITFGSKPAEFKYVELPWDAIAAAGAAKQKRYDEGDQTITNINDTFLKIGSREIDTKRKQELVDGFQQEIYNITDNFSGDIGAALPKIKELQRKLNYEITYGELGAIKKNYELEQARIKKIQESLDSYNQGKGGLDAYDAASLLAFDAQVNNVPTQKVGNTWSTYQEKTPIYATQDYSQAARNIAKDIDIQSLEEFSGMKHVGNGIFMDEKTTKERRDKDIIEEYVTNALLADPKYAQYLNWKNTITGKNDKVANVLQNNTVTTPEGVTYLPKLDAAGNEIGVMNPTAWANDYLTSDFRQAGRSAGEIYQRLKISRDRKYATPDLGGGKEDESKTGLSIIGNAPITSVPGSVLNPSFFDEQKRVPKTTMSGGGFGMGISTGGVVTLKGDATNLNPKLETREKYFNSIKDLSAPQQAQVGAYLTTLSKNANYQDAATRMLNGKDTEADRKLLYPQLKSMSQLAQGSTQMNSRITSIDKVEVPLVNQMLSGRTDEVINVAQLGTGFAGNLKVTDQNGKPMTYAQFVTKAKEQHGADALVMIPGKLRGANGLTNATGDLTYANAYQITIEGVPYYLHGDMQFDTRTDLGRAKEAERLQNIETAKFARAQTAPTGTFTDNYFGVPVQWVYMPDGTYNLTGLGTQGVDANNNPVINPVTPGPGTQFGSAEQMEQGLRAILSGAR
jgi:hypothetical protein